MAWRPKPKSSRRSQRTPGPAVRATGTKRPDRSCGRCRGNHQIVPLFRARTALGSAVGALIDNGASQPQKIRPGQAEPGRSGAVRTSADAITAALAPAGRTPTVLGNSGRRLVGVRYAVAAARHPAHWTQLAGLSRLR